MRASFGRNDETPPGARVGIRYGRGKRWPLEYGTVHRLSDTSGTVGADTRDNAAGGTELADSPKKP